MGSTRSCKAGTRMQRALCYTFRSRRKLKVACTNVPPHFVASVFVRHLRHWQLHDVK